MSTISRERLSGLLIVVLIGSAFAADYGLAMLYTNGTAWINGNNVPNSIALFSGDLVQTESGASANIRAKGANVLVLSDSLVPFDAAAVKLEHGRVNVVTTRGLAVRVGNLKVVPLSDSSSTEFEVADTDGMATIIARKGNLTLDDGRTSTMLPQGRRVPATKSRAKTVGAVPVPYPEQRADGSIPQSPRRLEVAR